MVAKKPRIVIIGAGMAGLTAANKLYTSSGGSDELFDLCVVEGGSRIGGRINTAELGGAKVEMGATWIHGIGGSPIHRIAGEIGALESDNPWEGMDGFSDDPLTVAEGGIELSASAVEPASALFRCLTEFSEGKRIEDSKVRKIASEVSAISTDGAGNLSVGTFLRRGLNAYWKDHSAGDDGEVVCGDWRRRSLEEAVFAMHENTQRVHTSADDLQSLDYAAESEYRMCPGEEITIARGYLSVIESLASVLPAGLIQLGRKVTRIEWRAAEMESCYGGGGGDHCSRPVRIHFSDGTVMSADHAIVTVSLGVLKAATHEDHRGLFDPPLPSFKAEAISRLGFGVVNKLFVEMPERENSKRAYPSLQLVFHRPDSEFRHRKVPWWMRKTASICPIHRDSTILLSWFAGKEALELERLRDDEIIDGLSAAVSSLLPNWPYRADPKPCNGDVNLANNNNNGKEGDFRLVKLLKSQWGTDPLFMGSYSYVAVGSSSDDLDSMAEPLPRNHSGAGDHLPPLQILFAGEATHRTHYSTTHGAYFSGLREASRLLEHYNCSGVSVSDLFRH